MKNLIIKLLVVVVAITLTTNLSAKSPVSIVNEIVITNPSTFMETESTNVTIKSSVVSVNPIELTFLSMEERKLHVIVEDNDANHTATAKVEVYSIDGQTVLGPFNLTEGITLDVDIDQREWSVSILESTEEAETSFWY